MNFSVTYTEGKLIGVSLVHADIKSQWQAHFLQIFPVNFSKLPKTHTSDKDTFEKFWQGEEGYTYEQFKKIIINKGVKMCIVTDKDHKVVSISNIAGAVGIPNNYHVYYPVTENVPSYGDVYKPKSLVEPIEV